MMRLPLFSARSFNLLSDILKHKPQLIINSKNYRTIINLSVNYLQHACYSVEIKSKSPLGSIIGKTANEKSEETLNEEEKQKQREQSWKTMKITLAVFGMSFTCLGAYLVYTLGGPELDHDGLPVKDELADKPLILQYLIRTYHELDYYRRLIKEPSREKLLPDPLPYPYIQPKYTLVLELTDVLVHPEWTYKTGWRFKKRPLLDFFLESLHGKYEIVVYTAEQGMTVFPLIEAIDPKNIIAYKLVRDATYFTGGHHVKALDRLNRDLSKVICIDWNAKNVKFNQENLFHVKRWSGNDDDTSLVDLASFLKTVADNDIEDVREVLKYYKEFDDPLETFKEKQKRLYEELEAQAAAKKESEASKFSRWAPSFLHKKPY